MELFYLLLLLVLLPLHSEAIDCTGLPDDVHCKWQVTELWLILKEERDLQTIVVQDGPFYTCLVQGTTMGTYQHLSVIMTYKVPDNDDVLRVRQFEMDCTCH